MLLLAEAQSLVVAGALPAAAERASDALRPTDLVAEPPGPAPPAIDVVLADEHDLRTPAVTPAAAARRADEVGRWRGRLVRHGRVRSAAALELDPRFCHGPLEACGRQDEGTDSRRERDEADASQHGLRLLLRRAVVSQCANTTSTHDVIRGNFH